jgi:PadR family transcriptional regulator, regulatory protein AphA
VNIKFVILGFLSERPLTGYDLKKLITDSPIFYWSGNNNQIYTTLVLLHKDNYVTREVIQQDQFPARKIYTITKQGLDGLNKFILSEPELPQYRNSFFLQLTWTDHLKKNQLDELIEKYENEVNIKFLMCKEENKRKNIQAKKLSRNAFIWSMIMENNISFFENELNWIRKLRKSLSEKYK